MVDSNGNYIRTADKKLFSDIYMFIDTVKKESDENSDAGYIFLKYETQGKILNRMIYKNDERFQIVIAKINKRHRKLLEEKVFPEVHNKLLIMYGKAYLEVVEKLQNIYQQGIKNNEAK